MKRLYFCRSDRRVSSRSDFRSQKVDWDGTHLIAVSEPSS